MKNLSYAEFLKNRRAEALTELEYDTLRTAHPKPSAGEVCVPVYTGFYKEKTVAAGQERTYYIFIPTHGVWASSSAAVCPSRVNSMSCGPEAGCRVGMKI